MVACEDNVIRDVDELLEQGFEITSISCAAKLSFTNVPNFYDVFVQQRKPELCRR